MIKECSTCYNAEEEGLCYVINKNKATMISDHFSCEKWKAEIPSNIFSESSMTIFNDKIIDYSIGTPGAVEFNFFRIWDHCKNLVRISKLLHFYHVHPQGVDSLSATDENCMEGFYLAFDMDINFYIIIFENDSLFDIHHTLKGYIRKKEKWIDMPNDTIRSLKYNELIMLKHLSYKKGEK